CSRLTLAEARSPWLFQDFCNHRCDFFLLFHMRSVSQIANIRSLIRLVVSVVALLSSLPADAGLTFTLGHLYSTSGAGGSPDIFEYSETGIFLSSITPQSLIAGDELRGIAFGPDGLLYAVKMHFAESGFEILALDSSGNTHATYTMGDINVRDNEGL